MNELESLPFALGRLGLALVINVALGLFAFRRGTVSRSGLRGGVVIGCLIAWAGGWGAFVSLVAFFLIGTAATRLGYHRKAKLGLAQEEGGRRGSKHALANCGTGLGLAISISFWPSVLPGLGLVAAFATAASDTLGSEVGQLYGRTPILPTTLRRVPPGTEGAVSVEGTVAGILGSLILSVLGAATGLYAWSLIWIPVAGAFFGTTLESYVGAIWGQDARIGNEAMNFLNTVAGACLAILLGWFLAGGQG